MRNLYILIFVLINICSVKGQQIITLSTGDTIHGVYSQSPSQDIEYISNSILVTYNFEKATIMEDPLYEGNYMWKYVGFGVNDIPSEPAIPYRLDSFTIPDGCSATIELVDSQFVNLPFSLSPARPPLTDSGDEIYDFNNVPSIAAFQGYYPSSVARLDGIDVYRGNRIANVLIAPLQYNYQTGVVRAYTQICYKISFYKEDNIIGNNVVLPQVESNDLYLTNVTLNAFHQIDRGAQASLSLPQKTYLILSTSKFIDSVEKFAEWKKLLGFDVQTILSDTWTPESIKSTVMNFYNNNNNLYYLLIVGDMEDVPSQSSSGEHITDFYYACLDGEDDTTPDLLYGRIPVKTNTEANIVVDKIINYEKNPTDNSIFYMTGLHCAEFQDNSPKDNYEDRRFTLTSEEVRSSLLDEGYNVIRVYKTQTNVNPLFWNKYTYSNGASIPDEIKRPGFEWLGNATDINTAINNGVFYILHRDHGSTTGWGTPSYGIYNINLLNNGNRLPVVFSINCLTGKFNINSDCFCEKFLKKENGGCVAIYGATQESYSGYNDVLTEGMFDAIWPSDKLRPVFSHASNNTGGITPTPTFELGQILNQGKARLTEVYGVSRSLYTKELFHCFGDPSMKIYTATPTPFTNVDITRNNDSILIDLNGDTATIVLQDLVTNETMCAMGTSATMPTNHSSNITVCVSSHNRIPFISEGTPYIVYIQNENVVGPADYNAEIIKAGTHVTTSKPVGPVIFESGDIRLQAKKIIFEGSTIVNKGTKLEIRNK